MANETVTKGKANVNVDEAESKDKNTSGIGIRIPTEMKTMVEAAAKVENVSVRGYAARVLAAAVGFTGDLTVGKGKDDQLSPEARKEKSKAVRKAKNEVFANLLAKYDQVAELLELTDEQKKLLGIQ